MSFAPQDAKWTDEILIGRYMFRFRVFLAHHLSDDLTLAFAGVNQEQVSAGLYIVVKWAQLFISGSHTD